MELGINDYCIAPVDANELQARVRTQLRRKQYQDTLRSVLEESVDLSTKDSLTGLFNRRYFDIHIKQMSDKIRNSDRTMSIMVLDVDHFKKVNDTYGHPAGDAVLKRLSHTLKSSFRVTDLIARYGGEEFVVLLGDVDIKQGKMIARKIRDTIKNTNFTIPEHKKPLKKTISIGVAEFNHKESLKNFIMRADKALYKAKKSGRNAVITG